MRSLSCDFSEVFSFLLYHFLYMSENFSYFSSTSSTTFISSIRDSHHFSNSLFMSSRVCSCCLSSQILMLWTYHSCGTCSFLSFLIVLSRRVQCSHYFSFVTYFFSSLILYTITSFINYTPVSIYNSLLPFIRLSSVTRYLRLMCSTYFILII